MYDASALSYADNVQRTANVAQWCHEREVWVEAELGEIGGKDGVHMPGVRTKPEEAAAYVAATGVDALAVAVGSSHAMITRDAVLDFGLIGRLRAAVSVPLVLHGSSGVPDQALSAAVRAGLTKINIATQLNKVFTAAVRERLAGDETMTDPRRYLAAGADILTHAPLDQPLDPRVAAEAADAGRVVAPTLTMMDAIVANIAPPGADYANARASVGLLQAAGVPILAGTDANDTPGTPSRVPHGASLHHELELLADAGLSPLDVLLAATARPARYFGLTDRGTIAPGKRADLLLVEEDPLIDIRATRSIVRVWCAGVEPEPAPTRK